MKTIKRLTPKDAMKLICKSKEPSVKLLCRDNENSKWEPVDVFGARTSIWHINGQQYEKFYTPDWVYDQCAIEEEVPQDYLTRYRNLVVDDHIRELFNNIESWELSDKFKNQLPEQLDNEEWTKDLKEYIDKIADKMRNNPNGGNDNILVIDSLLNLTEDEFDKEGVEMELHKAKEPLCRYFRLYEEKYSVTDIREDSDMCQYCIWNYFQKENDRLFIEYFELGVQKNKSSDRQIKYDEDEKLYNKLLDKYEAYGMECGVPDHD